MLHELFLALSGYNSTLLDSLDNFEVEASCDIASKDEKMSVIRNLTFGISKEYKEAKDNSVNSIETKITGMASFFHPSEITMISEILQVAKCYTKIKKFYEDISGSSVTELGNEKWLRNGYYLTTFATSVYEETSSFREKVIQFEEEYLKSPNLLLSTILINVKAFKHLFLELCHLINEIENSKLHGCKILDFLHKEVILSVGDTEIVLKRIKYNVQKVLIEQLTYWLIYGELLDPHEELFLKVSKKQKEKRQNNEERETEISANIVDVCLVVDMLPEFIPLPVAEKIVFIGEHILGFEREGKKAKGENSSRKGIILQEREQELLNQFESVSQKGSFSLTEFQNLIETVRLRVSQHIYSLVINADLKSELNHIKDIFLLGRGELYQAFFILSENRRPSITNINSLFQRAGRQILMEESLLDKFVVTYEKSNQVDDKISVWKNLRIEYQVKWPLHKFFDSNVQEKYNVILRFLLNIREAQLRLQYLFVSQKGNKAFRSDNVGLLCWTLRHHMSLLICNLQYYIQVDVLETQFSELRKHIDNLEDYQRLCFYHQSFLSSVITQCFLSHPLISLTISSILEKVKTFCNILEAAPSVAELRAEVEYVKEEFDRVASNLFAALKTLGQNKNIQHTAPLLLKIDYNKFYSKKPQNILAG